MAFAAVESRIWMLADSATDSDESNGSSCSSDESEQDSSEIGQRTERDIHHVTPSNEARQQWNNGPDSHPVTSRFRRCDERVNHRVIQTFEKEVESIVENQEIESTVDSVENQLIVIIHEEITDVGPVDAVDPISSETNELLNDTAGSVLITKQFPQGSMILDDYNITDHDNNNNRSTDVCADTQNGHSLTKIQSPSPGFARRHRRKRRNDGRQRRTSKWRSINIWPDVDDEESIVGFDMSLLSHRAECLSTDIDDQAVMNDVLDRVLEQWSSSSASEVSNKCRENVEDKVTASESCSVTTEVVVELSTTESDGEKSDEPADIVVVGDETYVAKNLAKQDYNSVEGVKISRTCRKANKIHNSNLEKKKKNKNAPSLLYMDMREMDEVSALYENGQLCGLPSGLFSILYSCSLELASVRGGAGEQSQRLRHKKKWRTTKARLQVKTKHCRSVKNCKHGTNYYMHHRVVKLMHMQLESSDYAIPSNREDTYGEVGYFATRRQRQIQASLQRINKQKALSVDDVKLLKTGWKATLKSMTSRRRGAAGHIPPLAVVVPHYAMNPHNADSDLSADLINILIALQERDLSPEDYELLLRLDDRVAPKTFDANRLQLLRTDIVGEGDSEQNGDNLQKDEEDNKINVWGACTICMEPYERNQVRKYLPCGHGFHANCIDNWLGGSSVICPLDGTPVEL